MDRLELGKKKKTVHMVQPPPCQAAPQHSRADGVPVLRSMLADSWCLNCLNSLHLLTQEETHPADLRGQQAPSS